MEGLTLLPLPGDLWTLSMGRFRFLSRHLGSGLPGLQLFYM